MPKSYPPEAVEYCLSLYLRFNGQQHDRIQSEMRRAGWVGWSKQNLSSRGDKEGWVEKYGWDAALKQHLALVSERKAVSADEQLLRETVEVRKRLKTQLDAQGANAARDLLYQYRDFVKLELEIRTKLEARGDTLSGFTLFWERLLDWLPDISPRAARELLSVADHVLEKAAAEYGETEDREANGGDTD